MVIYKKMNENKVRTHRPCNCKTKMFQLSNIYLIGGHMSHASLHNVISLSLHGKVRGEAQETKTI